MESIPQTAAKITQPGFKPQHILLARNRSKRRTKREEKVSQHYDLVMFKTLSAIGAPDCAFDYCKALIAVVGYDHAEEFELHDETLARATLGATHKLSNADRDIRIGREVARRRKQRERILDWQAGQDVPLLFEFNSKFNPETHKRNAKYKLCVTELFRQVLADTGIDASKDRIDRAVRVRASEYHERFTGEAKMLKTKMIQSPESELHRAATKARKAVEELLEKHGESEAIRIFETEFLSRFAEPESALFGVFQKINSNETKALSGATSATIVTNYSGEICSIENPKNAAQSDTQTPGFLPATSSRKPAVPLSVGQTVEDFIATTFNTPEARPDDWRDNPPTAKQLELLRRGNVFAEIGTRGQASDRINELMATGALTDFLSLSELESFDPKAKGRGNARRRFCCPLCGGGKKLDDAHRSLSVKTSTGVYFCHRCNAKGKLREFCEAAPVTPARQFPAAKPTPTKPASEKWRKWYADAKPISNTPGEDYLAGRGIPVDVAELAGVKFGTWWKASEQGDGAERFASVIFPARNEVGELVAAQARAITGDTKQAAGQKSDGVFESSPGVLKNAARIAVTEAPIDALALAAAGLPAIAIFGTSWPEWLPEYLGGREVFPSQDADEAGDKSASKFAEKLAGLAVVHRLRPQGGKDWAEVLQQHGATSIEAQIECALGCAEPGSFDDAEV